MTKMPLVSQDSVGVRDSRKKNDGRTRVGRLGGQRHTDKLTHSGRWKMDGRTRLDGGEMHHLLVSTNFILQIGGPG